MGKVDVEEAGGFGGKVSMSQKQLSSIPGLMGDKKDRRKERSKVLPRHFYTYTYNTGANQ